MLKRLKLKRTPKASLSKCHWNQDDFQAFIDNLEMNLETIVQRNPFLMLVIVDFNAKSKHWCSQNSTNFEGITIENVTSQFGLSQIIT